MRKIVQVLSWRYSYLLHGIGIVIAILFQVESHPPTPPEKWVVVYWWILGIITLLIDLYHFYYKHWKNGILIGLLIVFWILFYIIYFML